MKEYYKITEVARLYGLCTDTLRYYEEQGLLHPHRSEAGYRLYSIDDICNLNVIRACGSWTCPWSTAPVILRDVQWPPHWTCWTSRTLPSGRALPPCGTRAPPWMRAGRVWSGMTGRSRACCACWSCRNVPACNCRRMLSWSARSTSHCKKLAHRHEEVIRALGTQCMGAVLDESQRARGIYNHFCSVFYLGCRRREADGALPAGAYASVFFTAARTAGLRTYAPRCGPSLAAQGLRQDGPVMELYHIDAHDTARVDEYLTEVQVRVARAGQKGSGEHGV